MSARLRLIASSILLPIVASACTRSEPGTPTPTETTRTALPTGAQVPTDAGRIAVLDDVGSLSSVAPDGTDPVALADAVEGRAFARQPTWSPDGGKLAWVQLDTSGGSLAASVVTATTAGTQRTEAPTQVPPFYLSWDPTSSRVAYLGSSTNAPGIEMGVVDVAGGGGEAVPLDTGSPFYFSWSPSGDRLLVHVGRDRLDTLALDGTASSLGARPGAFNTPVWTGDGRSFVYVSRVEGRQRLIVRDAERQGERELAELEGPTRFVVNPDGSRVAFQAIEGDAGLGPLQVVDRRTGRISDVTDGTTPAFFWSPDGDRLLYLFVDPDDERIWLRWRIWGGPTQIELPRFLPTPVFAREYLQFFDQYAQSMSLWAPDGSAFTYAGIAESGGAGIWVQPARDGADPILIGDGVFASWSPA